MKILVLGAGGRAARAAILALRRISGVERIFIADRDAGALCKLSADMAHLPASPRYLDAEDERSLRQRMSEADLVLGCLGPFHRYEGRIARAAIEEGRDYLSLCDDPAAVEEVISLSPQVVRSGVRILCGCGLTPGLSNLLACRAGSRLDAVDEVELTLFLDLGPGLGPAALEHLMHSFAGKAPVRRKGRPERVRAGSWEEVVEFPPPIGRQEVYYLSHPEPVTLPGAIAGSCAIRYKAGLGGRARGLALYSLARLGEGDATELRAAAFRAAATGLARRFNGSCLAAVRVTASGTREGLPSKRTLSVAGDYYRLSGLMLAAAVGSMAAGVWPPGVYSPEMVLDEPAVFAWLRKAGVRIMIGEEMAGAAGGRHGPLTA